MEVLQRFTAVIPGLLVFTNSMKIAITWQNLKLVFNLFAQTVITKKYDIK